MIDRDTDDFVLPTSLLRDIFDNCTLDSKGCLIYPESSVVVRTRAGREISSISVLRAVWAMLNPQSHVAKGEMIVHTCVHMHSGGKQGEPVCVDPAHLVKGTTALRATMRKARTQMIHVNSVAQRAQVAA
jgi:hypothetical protein